MWQEYVFQKQTISELSVRYGVSQSTIKRRLSGKKKEFAVAIKAKVGVVLMDTTYFGRDYGVLLMIDATSGSVLWMKRVKSERLADYMEGVEAIESKGYKIEGVVCDGLRGMFQALSKYPVQFCQFHQVAIIRRKLTMHPKLKAGQELWKIAKRLKNSTREEFEKMLDEWYSRWSKFINERSKEAETGKTSYKHKPLRSAYRSLKNNLPYLFTYLDNKDINMPNTNNGIEGRFTALKNHLRAHNGMSETRRNNFVNEFFKA